MTKTSKPQFPHSFGVFSPTGKVLMVFADDVSAEQARQALIGHGYREDNITHYSQDEILSEFSKNEEHSIDPMQIGQELDKIGRYIEYAKKGAGFLVVHAPEDEISKRAVHIARGYQLLFAEKYNHLTLEELA